MDIFFILALTKARNYESDSLSENYPAQLGRAYPDHGKFSN